MNHAERTAAMEFPAPRMARSIPQLLARAFAQLRRLLPAVALRRRERRLSLCELLPLGEKRFVAVVQVDRQQYLIGGAPTSIALLAQLPSLPPAPVHADASGNDLKSQGS